MAPKRKRKTQQGPYGRKKKELQQEEREDEQDQGNEQEQEQQQEEVVLKRSSSCSNSDRDEVRLVTTPPPTSKTTTPSIINIMSSNKKKPKKGMNAETIAFLERNMQPVVLSNTHLADLSKHEGLFQKLGLWEFANLDFDLEPSLGDLAQLVGTYDPRGRFSIVKDTRIKISRADLARSLRISYKKEKNSSFLEMPDFEGTPSYSIKNCGAEGIKAALYFVSSRVYPCDDPSLISEEMVSLIEKALKSEQNIDWASLIWSRAEKELLQEKDLVKFYYALHFQALIRNQRPGLVSKGPTEAAHGEDDFFVSSSMISEDLDAANVDNEGDAPEDEGILDEKKSGEGLQHDIENSEKGDKEVGDMLDQQGVKDVLDQQEVGNVLDQQGVENVSDQQGVKSESDQQREDDVLDQQLEEENEGLGSVRNDEDKHIGRGLVGITLQPCNNIVEEKRKTDEDNRVSRRLQENNNKLDGPTEASSHGEHLVRPPAIENELSEHEKGSMSKLDICLDKTTSPGQPISEFDNGLMATADSNLEKTVLAESQFLDGDKTTMSNSTVHLEKSILTEPQLIDGDQNMIMNSTVHLEKTTSAEQMMFEMGKCMALNTGTHLPSSTSAEQMMMSELEKGMTLNSALHIQRDPSPENLILFLNQGPSHSGNVRKKEIDEDNEFHGAPEKKHRSDLHLSFGACMENVYEYLQRAENCYMNEKQTLTQSASVEIQELYQQLNQKNYTIQRLQMNKHEEQQRAIELSRLKNNLLLTNKTFFGYTKALEEAQDTINHLRETIRLQDSTIGDLHQQLEQKNTHMEELEHYFKEHVDHLNQYIKEMNEKLLNDLNKGMHKQASLEEKLDMLKAQIEKQQPEIEKQQPEVEKEQLEPEKEQPEIENEQPETEKDQLTSPT